MAAAKCEEAGFKPLLIESDENIGGRVQTDHFEGFNLERGFQVFIDTYEKARELLDFEKLDLKSFASGSKIYDEKGSFMIADPRRDLSSLPGMIFSRVGSFSDKLKILKLSRSLQSKSLSEVFDGEDQSTSDYLKAYGFSEKVIEHFFRPFFGGIFLERQLSTGAGMFRFVFRNFSKGNACIPAKGMGEIPKQLLSKLKQTELRLSTKVKKVTQDGAIELENGEKIRANKIIVACNPDKLLPQLSQSTEWNHTTTLYFSGEKALPNMKRSIGLDARTKSTINNFARHDEVVPDSCPENRSLWSVTVRGEPMFDEVQRDLAALLGVEKSKLKFLREYRIAHALPKVAKPTLTLSPESTALTERIHLAGDYLTNASIDGAMRAGENAAMAVTETLEVMA